MKTASDPRHQARIDQVKKLFAYSFNSQDLDDEIQPIVEKLDDIDTRIAQTASEWKLSDMNKIDLAILRLGVFELLEGKLTPNIIIDEAIEIAKEYGADNSKSFVNAVLSKIAQPMYAATTQTST